MQTAFSVRNITKQMYQDVLRRNKKYAVSEDSIQVLE